MSDRISRQKIDALMQARGLVTKSQLCEAADISRPSLYALLAGQSPYRETVRKLAQVLEVEPRELLTNSGGESVDHS